MGLTRGFPQLWNYVEKGLSPPVRGNGVNRVETRVFRGKVWRSTPNRLTTLWTTSRAHRDQGTTLQLLHLVHTQRCGVLTMASGLTVGCPTAFPGLADKHYRTFSTKLWPRSGAPRRDHVLADDSGAVSVPALPLPPEKEPPVRPGRRRRPPSTRRPQPPILLRHVHRRPVEPVCARGVSGRSPKPVVARKTRSTLRRRRPRQARNDACDRSLHS